jgi:hypothetical protein
MKRRKKQGAERTRTVVVYRDGVVGYYSRDRAGGGTSPVYSSEAILAAARAARAAATTSGASRRWPAAS